MAEVNLSTKKAVTTELNVKLTNTDTGELVEHAYSVAKLTGRAALESQLALAEFARESNGQAIVGSMMVRSILAGTTPVGDAPDFMALFDGLDGEAMGSLIEALVDAATSSTVGE